MHHPQRRRTFPVKRVSGQPIAVRPTRKTCGLRLGVGTAAPVAAGQQQCCDTGQPPSWVGASRDVPHRAFAQPSYRTASAQGVGRCGSWPDNDMQYKRRTKDRIRHRRRSQALRHPARQKRLAAETAREGRAPMSSTRADPAHRGRMAVNAVDRYWHRASWRDAVSAAGAVPASGPTGPDPPQVR